MFPVLAIAYVLLGALLATVACRMVGSRSTKVLLGSFVAALFFSFALIQSKIVVAPCPTLIAIILLVADHLSPGYSPTADNASFYIAAPFALQWAVWAGAFASIFCRRSARP